MSRGEHDGPRVVLAVTGGIAAYKACVITRRLRERGVSLRVAMSRSASGFVSPLTFAALSGNRVIDDLFEDPHPEEIAHVRWAESCDLLVVAPATADFLAKMAHGLADDFPSTLHLAVTAPVLIAPAMEDDMFRHPAVQRNLETLRGRGVHTVGPGVGGLASGRDGPGRMAEPEDVVAACVRLLESGPAIPWLRDRRVLVTAGPTLESIDPIRVLTNRSSGKMGYALAAEASFLGADVTLVSGPSCLPAPVGTTRVDVESAAEMAEAVHRRAADQDVVVMAAAVADFRPAEASSSKIKKAGRDELEIRLTRTEDILAALASREDPPLLVGFAAESEDPEAGAREKLETKGCDLVVGNRIGSPTTGAGADDNEVVIVDRLGGHAGHGPASKRRIATVIWESVREFRDRLEEGA